MAVSFSGHFWDRLYARPKVKQDLAVIDNILKAIGDKDTYVEDIPELKYILVMKHKRFLFQEGADTAKYIFGLQKDPVVGKHKLVGITGLNPEFSSFNLENITRVLQSLASGQ